MKILVMSDSHGKADRVREAIADAGSYDMMIHLGDSQADEQLIRNMAKKDCRMVEGNCDFFTDLPSVLYIQLGPHRAMLTHGHHHYISAMGIELLVEDARANGCDIVMFGHTHKPMEKSSRGVLVLNPGSISFPRQADRKPSYMLVTLENSGEISVETRYL